MQKHTLLLLAAFFLTFGCSKKDSYDHRAYSMADGGDFYETAAAQTQWEGAGYNPEGPAGIEGETPRVYRDMSNMYGRTRTSVNAASQNANEPEAFAGENAERKIIKRANIRIRAENLDAADAFINDLMESYGAYSASTVIEENSHRYSIRVPSSAYKAFFAGMDGMGKVLNRSESADDVTVRYYDLEGRLATKKELLKTFQSYLGKAKNIEEILSVERKIAELQSEIDGTGKELRNLAYNVDFSTIELVILGPAVLSPHHDPTLAYRMKELFGGFGNFLSSLTVILVGIVVYGIPILLLLILFFWLLFGKIGLLKKLWRLAAGKNR